VRDPCEIHAALVWIASLGETQWHRGLQFAIEIRDPDSHMTKRVDVLLSTGAPRTVALAPRVEDLRFDVHRVGVWTVAVTSEDKILAQLSLEVRLRSATQAS
jgi:hypothetical protein